VRPREPLTDHAAAIVAPTGRAYDEVTDQVTDLRWIVLPMIEESARAAGHFDIARELIDGRTGLCPRRPRGFHGTNFTGAIGTDGIATPRRVQYRMN
jgi:hypothetical protein